MKLIFMNLNNNLLVCIRVTMELMMEFLLILVKQILWKFQKSTKYTTLKYRERPMMIIGLKSSS